MSRRSRRASAGPVSSPRSRWRTSASTGRCLCRPCRCSGLRGCARRASGSAAAQMVEAIAKDQKRVLPVCMKLEGEYGINDCYLGVPVILGKNGVERVIELQLNDSEMALLQTSRKHVKDVMNVFDGLKK